MRTPLVIDPPAIFLSFQSTEEAAHAAQRRAAEFEGISIEVLREDVEAAQSEAALANER
jgi:hypothetical protein